MSAATRTSPTGRERPFGTEEIIVSKTDRQGKILYANDVFLRVSGYDEDELLGAPHSIIRHPDMPRAVFKLLWDTVESGKEIFAYVNNMARNGDHYWVLAHVTPSFGPNGDIVGYHSNRRCPDRSALAKIEPIYDQLRDLERSFADRKDGLVASTARLEGMLAAAGVSYHEWVWTL
jgi:PAS domain S-box-containing protein